MEDMDDSCGWCTVENVAIDWPLQLTLHHECQTLVWQIEVTCGVNWTNIKAGLLALGFASLTSREPGGNWLGSGSWSLSSLKLQPEQIWTTCAKNLEGNFNLVSCFVAQVRDSNAVGQCRRELYCAHPARQSSFGVGKCGGWPIFRRISNTPRLQVLLQSPPKRWHQSWTQEIDRGDAAEWFEFPLQGSLGTQFIFWWT